MYIHLINRPDRMGANLTWFIMQIIYAHHHKYFIHYDYVEFSHSPFVKMIIDYIAVYNSELEIQQQVSVGEHGERKDWIEFSAQDWPGNNMIVCRDIQQDLVSYFKKHLYEKMIPHTTAFSFASLNNSLIKDPKKTICVHLRLDDVKDRMDYEGIFSTTYYRTKLNEGRINIDLHEEHLYGLSQGIWMPGWGRHYNPYDCQAPIAEHKVQRVIEEAKQKYPEHEVVIMASPLQLPQGQEQWNDSLFSKYTFVGSDDPSQDLYWMCQCDVLICSRSLFCFSAVYLGSATEYYLPMWGHIAGTGLTSKYDKNEGLIHYWYS